MTTPTPEQVRVATAALRAEADRWARQSEALTDAGGQAAELDMTRLESGIFAIFASAYQQAQAQTVGRCTEGGRVMSTIGATLREVADTYDREEAANEHRFRGLY